MYYAKGHYSVGKIADIRAVLDQDRAVMVVMTVSSAFHEPDDEGVIDSDEPGDATRVHAAIAVGYGTRGSDFFTLVRNSWGPNWGIGGCGWLADRYLSPRLVTFATLERTSGC